VRKFEYVRSVWRLLLASLVVVIALYFPGWRFDHMTSAEHVDAARIALQDRRFDESLRHLNAIGPDATDAVALRRKLTAAQEALAAQQQAAIAQQEQARSDTHRAAVRELEQSLRNLGYDVTVAQAPDPDTVTIASKGFDDSTSRDRFLLFLSGPNSPAAAACAAGIQAVRFKDPGVFFRLSDTYSLDCFRK
jgi:hypothetical protein